MISLSKRELFDVADFLDGAASAVQSAAGSLRNGERPTGDALGATLAGLHSMMSMAGRHGDVPLVQHARAVLAWLEEGVPRLELVPPLDNEERLATEGEELPPSAVSS